MTALHLGDHRTAVLALTLLGGYAGHETGDYLVQLDCDAQAKQQHTPAGRRALARHAITYGLSQAATKAFLYRAAGVRVPAGAQAAGTALEILLHALIDDGRLLRRFATVTGKLGFHDVNAGGVNGRMLMDQATHKGIQIPLGAVLTAVLTRRA